MRYLIISLCFLITGCVSYQKKQNFQLSTLSETSITNPYFSDTTKDYVYKASIQVYDNHFGGLLIIKKIADEYHRVVFTTEMGNKLFDFSFEQNAFRVNFIIDEFDKKILLNSLKADFMPLIQEKVSVSNSYIKNELSVFETTFYNKKHYYYTSKYLEKIVRIGRQKEKVLFLFSDINNNIARHIQIIHNSINLNITLKSIK